MSGQFNHICIKTFPLGLKFMKAATTPTRPDFRIHFATDFERTELLCRITHYHRFKTIELGKTSLLKKLER